MSQSFIVKGGKKLNGTLIPQGAKNEALQIISAVLLTAEEVTIANIPDIRDVNLLIEILKDLGVKVNRLNEDTYTFKADDIDLSYLQGDVFKKKGAALRGSIMIIGPLLARFKKAYMPKPGGDKIGRRRLDTHMLALQALGAHIEIFPDGYEIKSSKLIGADILLDEASVTGTENAIMAACFAEGTTTIRHAASEPHVQGLCKFLNH
jgi:UDP-N-acetylglucosamine 1-carboxyvinyltransferase